MMLERGLTVDHSTVYRWVQAYAPELDKRCRPHLRPTNDSWRVDETYIKVKGEWKYLYRAVDSLGFTLDFMLSAKRDALAAERFFRKALKASHNQEPRVINVDKNAVITPRQLTHSLKTKLFPKLQNYDPSSTSIILWNKTTASLNVSLIQGWGLLHSIQRGEPYRGYEAMNMIRKGQVQGVEEGDIMSQVEYARSNFWSYCLRRAN